MANTKRNDGAVQIEDVLVQFFPNQKRLLNITFYENVHDRIHNYCELHTHSYAEVFACKMGEVTIKTNKSQYILASGDVAIIPAGVVHTKLDNNCDTLWCSAGVLCTKCKTSGNGGLFNMIYQLVSSGEVTVIKPLCDFYDIIMAAVLKEDKNIPYSDKLRLAYEFCRLADSADISFGKKSEFKTSAPDVDRLLKLEILINSEYMLNVSNQQLADKLFLSERQLSRLVNRYYGVPLHSLIINKRISTAASMLLKTNDTIEDIAASVGFNGKASFYREFQKIYGLTPLQYRKNHRK